MSGDTDAPGIPPDDAFTAVGNETRVEVLRVLADAEAVLSFSTLRDRVGMQDSGQFNYHLGKLVGHFVARTNDGYRLRQAGRRVVEAVLSGAVTADPVIEPTELDRPCHYCGAPTVVSYRGEWVGHACTECEGAVSASGAPATVPPELVDGYLGGYALPPAGVRDRDPAAVLTAARAWTMIEVLAIGDGLCPRCSAPVERTVQVCEDHAADGLCERCGLRHAVLATLRCTNCPHSVRATLLNHLLSSTPVLSFLTDHGHNPHDPSPALYRAIATHETSVDSTSPFAGQVHLTLSDETLVVTVDADCSVGDATRR